MAGVMSLKHGDNPVIAICNQNPISHTTKKSLRNHEKSETTITHTTDTNTPYNIKISLPNDLTEQRVSILKKLAAPYGGFIVTADKITFPNISQWSSFTGMDISYIACLLYNKSTCKKHTQEGIAIQCDAGMSLIYSVIRQFVQEGFDAAITWEKRKNPPSPRS